MPKEFYTEKDIEDMVKRGITTLEINDCVVLTELAYEKAGRLGMRLVQDKADNPPSAPVRPYITQKQSPAAAVPSSLPRPVYPAAASAAAVNLPQFSQSSPKADGMDLQQRIRNAVVARLGTQVDAKLLDVIIKRVLASTGVK